MEILYDNLRRADLICQGETDVDRFTLLYPFTTENIAGYINHFDLEGKSLLTVGSSGDQAMNAILKGSKDITIIDVNPFVRYYYYLKEAAMLTLTMEEFIRFFHYYSNTNDFIENRHPFGTKLYEKLKPVLSALDYESYTFWDTLFTKFNPESVRRRLFLNDEHENKILRKLNIYLTSSNYIRLRDNIKNARVTFLTQDVEEAKVERKFDNIWLSNISQWIGTEQAREMYATFANLLEQDGSMLLSYVYNLRADGENGHLDRMLETFNDVDLEEIRFKGVRGYISKCADREDCALIFRKP